MHTRAPEERLGIPLGTVLLAVSSAILLVGSLGLLIVRLWRKRGDSRRVAPITTDSRASASSEGDEDSKAFKRVRVVVMYGTQTGTAEGFAKTISKEVKHNLSGKAEVTLADLDEFGSNDEEYETRLGSDEMIALLLLATYGDGEPTDNAARFCRLLTRLSEEADAADTGGDKFSKLTYAVFGLGNRQYEHFNAVAKAVDKQLAGLGARRLLGLALGDDDQCMEDDFEAWKAAASSSLEQEVESRWNELNKEVLAAESNGVLANGHVNGHAPGEDDGDSDEDDDWTTATQALEVVFHEPGTAEADAAALQMDGLKGGDSWHGHTVTSVPVALCRELHSSASPRSCLHVELDVSSDESTAQGGGHGPHPVNISAGLRYAPGDHVAVFPQNEDADVELATRLLGLADRLHHVFSLRPHEKHEKSHAAAVLGSAFLTPMRLDTALRSMVDLHASPKKAALLMLAAHASDAAEAKRLQFLASPAGKDEYMNWVVRSHRSLLEVLQEFPSSRPPLSVFLTALAPRLQPRFYSISSSLALCPGKLSITCAVVDEVTPAGRVHHGVCSFDFKRKAAELAGSPQCPPTLPIFIRPSTFRLPATAATPIIMVGPGTGVAPFRGFLQERMALLKAGRKGELGPALMFFGCRSQAQDYIYREELAEWQEAGALSALHVAFSRDGPKKVYVQHLLLEQGAEVWRLWNKSQGHVYVCGDAKHMAWDVHAALASIAQSQGHLSGEAAEAWIKEAQHEERYQRDVW